MKDKLSKAKDFLVIGVSLEINIFLTALLFGAKMGDYLWTIAKVNLVFLFFYAWLWFIEYYLSNFSASAMLDKKIRLEELKKENKDDNNDFPPPPPTSKKLKNEDAGNGKDLKVSKLLPEELTDKIQEGNKYEVVASDNEVKELSEDNFEF